MKIDKDSYGVIVPIYLAGAAAIAADLVFIDSPLLSWPIAGVIFIFISFVLWFHRVPSRSCPGDERTVTSVADGKVVIIEKVYEKEYLRKECIQVSVYMNFFDVHANFWPMTGEITYYKYHPGNYFLAFLPKASERNEHSSTAIRSPYGEIFFKQIAGTFARRIVCYSKTGEKTKAGEQCGIIKFGSRIDMFFPLDTEILVKLGDTTRACETPVARLNGTPSQ